MGVAFGGSEVQGITVCLEDYVTSMIANNGIQMCGTIIE